MKDPKRDDLSLRPVGFALAAVVAGLGTAKADAAHSPAPAPLEPTTHEKSYVIDPTNHPGFEQDESLVIGRSEPVAPLR